MVKKVFISIKSVKLENLRSRKVVKQNVMTSCETGRADEDFPSALRGFVLKVRTRNDSLSCGRCMQEILN